MNFDRADFFLLIYHMIFDRVAYKSPFPPILKQDISNLMGSISVKVSYCGETQDVALIDIEGYIDSATSPEVTSIIDRQLNLGIKWMIVNLKNVDYISNTGWDTLLSGLKKTRESGGDIVLAKMAKNIQELFELMELSYVFKFYTTVHNAKTHFLSKSRIPKPIQMPKTMADLKKSHPPIPPLSDEKLLELELLDQKPGKSSLHPPEDAASPLYPESFSAKRPGRV